MCYGIVLIHCYRIVIAVAYWVVIVDCCDCVAHFLVTRTAHVCYCSLIVLVHCLVTLLLLLFQCVRTITRYVVVVDCYALRIYC